jgi:hypothetical protein
MVGFGSIGQGVLPLILRHIGITSERITVVTADQAGAQEAVDLGVTFVVQPLMRENYRRVLEPLLGRGDFLVNLSVDVSSIALVKLCQERGALYIDTCIEPWAGGYTDTSLSAGKRTNYALRDAALASLAVMIPGSAAASHEMVRAVREAWIGRVGGAIKPLPTRAAPVGRRIRVGYLSAFFGERNWMRPAYGVINRHDRARFEVYLIADGAEPSAAAGYVAQAQGLIRKLLSEIR